MLEEIEMKAGDIKVGGVYVAQVDGAECHVKVVRVIGKSRIHWEVQIVQAPFGAHNLVGKKRIFEGAARFKSEVYRVESGDNSHPLSEQETTTLEVVKENKPLIKRSPLDRLRLLSKTDEPSKPVEVQSAEGVLSSTSVNPECEGYMPNLATGVCRCKSCRNKPHAERTRRPFVNAQTAGPSTLIVRKGSPPTTESSASTSGPKKKTGLMAKTKGVVDASSSSQGSADTGKTSSTQGKGGEHSSDPLVSGQGCLDPGMEQGCLDPLVSRQECLDPGMDVANQALQDYSSIKRDTTGARSVGSASTLPAQSLLKENQMVASPQPTGSAVTGDTSGEDKLAVVAQRFLEEKEAERSGGGVPVGNIMPRKEWSGSKDVNTPTCLEDRLQRGEITRSEYDDLAVRRMRGEFAQTKKRSVLPDTPLVPDGGAPHLQVMAYAGTGKSTTIVQGLVNMRGGVPKINPSEEQEAVWKRLGIGKNDTVRVSAFSNAISNEMGQKIHDAGLVGKGVEATGIHKLGFAAVRAQFGYLPPNNYAVTDIVCKKLGGEFSELKTQPGMLVRINATADLVSLCKQTMTVPTEQGLEELSYRYDIELDDQRDVVFQLVPDVLEACKKPQGKIAFDDMIWLPLVLELHIPRVDHQIIDESQDLNRMQQEFMYRAGHRITFVGDEHQAIMGFAGADSESMKRMYKTLAESNVGCDRLPLTVTRRCGKAIVREAQKYVPGFRAHDSNVEGLVRYAAWTWKGTGSDRVLVPWEKTYGPLVQDGAMVVCRTNAPTISECFRFLARGIKAVVLGRKVGQGLIDLIRKAEKGKDGIGEDAPIEKLIGWLSDWLTKEVAKEQAKKSPSEGKIQNLEDKFECLMTFAKNDCARTSEVVYRINTVFADKKCPKCGKPYDVDARVCDVPACGGVSLVLPGGVKFSSIHKSKGLEAKQVIYLCPPGTGMREDKMQAWELEQEQNLRYVAVTRAIEELVYVQ